AALRVGHRTWRQRPLLWWVRWGSVRPAAVWQSRQRSATLPSLGTGAGGRGMRNSAIVPGAWVRHSGRPDWGLGQVQSAIGARVTVNFEHQGKVVINTDVVQLEVVAGDRE